MPEISTSPLVPHIETQGLGWIDFLRSLPVRPRAVKVFSGDMARAVKAIDPRIITIKRRFDQWGNYLGQGRAGGVLWIRDQADLEGVDIVEGLNEVSSFDDAVAVRLLNDFDLGVLEEAARRGVKACIWNLAVGNPREDLVRYLKPSAQLAVDMNMYLGYHFYGPALILHGEEFLAMRAPLKLEPLLRDAGLTGTVRWLGTKGGFDGVNSPVISGGYRWLLGKQLVGGLEPEMYYDRYGNRKYRVTPQVLLRARENVVNFRSDIPSQVIDHAFITSQYEAFGARLTALNVLACAVFTFYGTQQWFDYEHTTDRPMMIWFADHLARHTGVPVPPPGGTMRAVVVADGGIRVRLTTPTGTVIGNLPKDSVVDVFQVVGEFARLKLFAGGVELQPGTSDPDPTCYARMRDATTGAVYMRMI